MSKHNRLIKIFQLLALVRLIGMCKAIIEYQEISEEDYNSYYEEQEKMRIYKESVDKLDEPKITLSDVFWPFIQTFWLTFVIIFVILIIILCVCIISYFNWTTICSPLEYFECQGHALLSKRFERLKTPGVYIRKNGTQVSYEPIADELELINDISQRLQQN